MANWLGSLSTHVRNYGDVFGQAAGAFDEDLGEIRRRISE
jgi:hypothetical protein